MLKIEKELQDVQNIVHQNLQDLLARGETMDVLMQKSNELNSTSIEFYKKAKKSNSKCCNTS